MKVVENLTIPHLIYTMFGLSDEQMAVCCVFSEGHYVYSDINQGSAYLLSPELALPPNKTHCLTFWYYIYGRPAEAELHVYVSRDQAYSRPEWSRSSAPQDSWVKGQVVIKTQSLLQVIFAAELDNSFSGVALDDISLMEGNCYGGTGHVKAHQAIIILHVEKGFLLFWHKDGKCFTGF